MTSGVDWSGAVGDTWAAEWRRTDRSFSALSPHLDAAILAAAPVGSFRALDIGCGAGGTTLALAAARPDVTILGVDLSADLVAVARDRAASARCDRARFVVGDAAAVAIADGPFDLFCSRHGVMFFDDPVAAFADLRAAAAPDARLIFSCFAAWADNGFARSIADAIDRPPPDESVPGPFAFADPQKVGAILAAGGWRYAVYRAVPFGYRAGEGDDPVADARSFFQRIGPAAPAIREATGTARTALLEKITAVIDVHRVADAIDFSACAWIWSAMA